MDCLVWFFYSIYSWFTNLGWLCRRTLPFYYLVGPDGKQHVLNDKNLALYDNILVIYYTPAGTRYRFHPLFKNQGVCMASTIKSAYQSFVEPKKYKLFAVNATIHERVHTINAIEFNIVGNEIFSPIFNLWLCSNYLHIAPSVHVDVSYIDDSTSICYTRGPIYFERDALTIETSYEKEKEKEKEKEPITETNSVSMEEVD